MPKFLSEFKDFLFKSNGFALALAVVIGIAITNLITAIKDDLLMPVIGLATPSGKWEEITLGEFKIGHLAGAFLDFVIIAFVVFLLTKLFVRSAPKPPTKACPECLETIPLAAKRCRACTTAV